MQIIVQQEWYSVKQVFDNPNRIYIFGDNSMRIGNGGQAQVRGRPNVFGIATKRSPAMSDVSFFNDSFNDFTILLNDIVGLYNYVQELIVKENQTGEEFTIVFPADGLGTGLSQLPKRSPFINKQLKMLLEQYFDIATLSDGTLKLKE